MKNILTVSHAIISILLTLIILIQSKDEGLSATFSANQSFQATRRGADKVIFSATILLAVLFVVTSLAFVFFN
ncbi:preprotein translocase subunit SecG [Candidatus Peregrinibacteria bacterium]|nr:preprotein translocase subunit SecG [Candidatus Peregrinibacteria bacterium]